MAVSGCHGNCMSFDVIMTHLLAQHETETVYVFLNPDCHDNFCKAKQDDYDMFMYK